MITDTIDGVIVDEDEGGFYLVLSGQYAEYRFNIHGVAHELLKQVRKEIAPWWAEVESAMGDLYGAAEAYELSDPKHPRHHEVMSDASDL
jgi:hypothetical protein